MPIVKIFTDGSCLNNQNSKKGQSFGGYGCRIEYPNKIIEEFSAGLSGSKITNNIGEFMAFKRALERMIEVKVKDIVHIYTDSMLLINTYTKWAKIWAIPSTLISSLCSACTAIATFLHSATM